MTMTATDTADAIRVLFTLFKQLTDEEALAGIIVTETSFHKLRKLFGEKAEVFRPSGLHLDEGMEHGFVVDGLVILKGTAPSATVQ